VSLILATQANTPRALPFELTKIASRNPNNHGSILPLKHRDRDTLQEHGDRQPCRSVQESVTGSRLDSDGHASLCRQIHEVNCTRSQQTCYTVLTSSQPSRITRGYFRSSGQDHERARPPLDGPQCLRRRRSGLGYSRARCCR
jgi:hypothetical protein